MILDLSLPVNKSRFNTIQKIRAKEVVGQFERIRRNIYKDQMKKIRQIIKFSAKNMEQKKKKIYPSWSWTLKTLAEQKLIVQAQKFPLPVFPHGYYAFYIPLMKSCRFPDQYTWFFSYFHQLQDKGMQDKKQLCCEQINTAITKMQQLAEKEKIDKTQLYEYVWERSLQKFTCQFDTIKKLEIYVEALKHGMKIFKKFHKKMKTPCDLDILQLFVLRSQFYFGLRKISMIRNVSKTFSMYRNEQINQSSISCTLKMFFCPICGYYDCGRHQDDGSFFENKYDYVCPDNSLTQKESVDSALHLISRQSFILNNKNANQTKLCSEFCYQKIKSKEQFNKVNKRKNCHDFRVSPIAKGLISIAINTYGFQPCLIWSWIQLNKQKSKKVVVTCDLIFAYLLDEYDLLKKLGLKLFKDQETQLKYQKRNLQNHNIPYLNVRQKKIVSEMHYNNNLSVCHHHFMGNKSIDQECNNCVCSQRGFCRAQCLCSIQCNLKKGCNCHKTGDKCNKDKCICFINQRQCQPGLCDSCFDFNSNHKVNCCTNNQIIQGKLCLVRIGKSKIEGAGLGLFAGQNIKNKRLVYTYTGEMISHNTECFRETTRRSNDFYNYDCNKQIIDSRYFGNMARFINHGNDGEANLYPKNKMSNGQYVIALYAKRDIAIGQQLYFNYDGTGDLFENHKSKYPFIKKKKGR